MSTAKKVGNPFAIDFSEPSARHWTLGARAIHQLRDRLPEIRPVHLALQRASIVRFPLDPASTNRMGSPELYRRLICDIRLPFEYTGILDAMSATVMWDVSRDSVGAKCERHFIDMQHTKPLTTGRAIADSNHGALIVFGSVSDVAYIENSSTEQDMFLQMCLKGGILAYDDGQFEHLPIIDEKLVQHASQAVITYYKQVAYLLDPNLWLFEESAMPGSRQYKHHEKAMRSNEIPDLISRPRYMAMSTNMLADFLRERGVTRNMGSHVNAHSRRRHKRTFRHPRFSNMRGQTIEIRQQWVGDTQWEYRWKTRTRKLRVLLGLYNLD